MFVALHLSPHFFFGFASPSTKGNFLTCPVWIPVHRKRLFVDSFAWTWSSISHVMVNLELKIRVPDPRNVPQSSIFLWKYSWGLKKTLMEYADQMSQKCALQNVKFILKLGSLFWLWFLLLGYSSVSLYFTSLKRSIFGGKYFHPENPTRPQLHILYWERCCDQSWFSNARIIYVCDQLPSQTMKGCLVFLCKNGLWEWITCKALRKFK